jgi:hypothetical protein
MQKSESGKGSVVHDAERSAAINLLKEEAFKELKRELMQHSVPVYLSPEKDFSISALKNIYK